MLTSMKKKKYLNDYSLWLLLTINLYFLFVYYDDGKSINAIILLYWLQSFFTGCFNFLAILTFKNTARNKLVFSSRIKEALFFLFHYSFFHIGLFIFLITDSITTSILFNGMFKIAFWFLIASLAMDFWQSKIRSQIAGIDIGNLFFLPYLRILPLAAIIICIAYFPSTYYLLFMILKTFTDVVMYIIFQNLLGNPSAKK